MYKPDEQIKGLLRTSGSDNYQEAMAALGELAKAVQEPLREAVLDGDTIGPIFDPRVLEPGATPEYDLHFLAPGTETDFVAWTNPGHGRIPERRIEGDYVMVPTYSIAASIDWLLSYARDARWDVVGSAGQVMEAQFTKKLNDDGWHTIISAAVDRNIVVLDSDASAGQFTKRLVSLMKNVMRRNGGGNSASNNRGMLTDLYMSPEAMEDIRNWNVDQIDEVTRREIFTAEDGALNRIFGVNLHDLDELGEGQEYNTFYENTLSATIPSGDVEMVVGLDLRDKTFIMPIREELKVFPDPALHRSQMAGLYGWMWQGFLSADSRRCLLGSL